MLGCAVLAALPFVLMLCDVHASQHKTGTAEHKFSLALHLMHDGIRVRHDV